jgi:hypothetical protein
MYVAARLMWDHTADPDAILADFADKFFGPAAAPMGGYVKLMDAALRDSPCCTGCAWDMPHHYPAAVRAKARDLLAEAVKRTAGKGVYAERVKAVAGTFDRPRPRGRHGSSWGNQGLRYYKGLAWYRQTLDVPAEHAGE